MSSSPLRRRALASALAVCSAACAHASPSVEPASGAAQTLLLADTARPVFFLGPEADAPVFGFGSSDVQARVDGPTVGGRVPVRIDGALRVKGYVPEDALTLCVQRRGRIRGTPVYVAPNQRVRPLGPDAEPDRLRVRASPVVAGAALGPFEGSYPRAGLSLSKAPEDAESPVAGARYEHVAGRALPLYDAPRGQVVAVIPAQPAPLVVEVLDSEGSWLAVRAGEGPYLIGYTNEALRLLGSTGPSDDARAKASPPNPDPDGVPQRLRGEPGLLKRVAKETQVLFNGQVVAVFKRAGWARVLAEYRGGLADVFAAADDGIAVRGLVSTSALSDPPPNTTPEGPSAAATGLAPSAPAAR